MGFGKCMMWRIIRLHLTISLSPSIDYPNPNIYRHVYKICQSYRRSTIPSSRFEYCLEFHWLEIRGSTNRFHWHTILLWSPILSFSYKPTPRIGLDKSHKCFFLRLVDGNQRWTRCNDQSFSHSLSRLFNFQRLNKWMM